MSTTNGLPDDPQSHGTPPAQPPTPGQTPAAHPRAQDAFAWTTLGLFTACCTAGVVLTLTGHEEAGAALIHAAFLAGAVRAQK